MWKFFLEQKIKRDDFLLETLQETQKLGVSVLRWEIRKNGFLGMFHIHLE